MSRVEHIGDATLYLSDCIDILPTIDPMDAIVTDPPYSSGARRDAQRAVRGSMIRSMEDEDWFSHDAMTTWGFSWFIRSAFGLIRERLIEGAHIYVFIDWRQTPNVYGMLEACGYRVNHCLVWRKTSFGMGAYWRNQHENIVFASRGMPLEMASHAHGSVLDAPIVRDRKHPTEKPVELIREILEASGRSYILDPFMGSGTTGVVCANLGRKFVGIEIEERYFDIACRRIEDAYKQPRLFDEPKPAPVQEEMYASH